MRDLRLWLAAGLVVIGASVIAWFGSAARVSEQKAVIESTVQEAVKDAVQ